MTRLTHWHWTCNQKQFINKFHAIDENLKTGEPIKFMPHRSITNTDFSANSEKTWQQLCRERALNLRNSYDYIKVWFSGGIDSVRMLRSFIENNIYIDEIVIIRSGIKAGDYEILDTALPIIEKCKNQLRKTKINIVTPTLSDYKKIRSNPYWMEDFNQLDTWHFRLNNWFECREYEKALDHASCANIIGKEKPLIVYHNNEWWLTWMDLNINASQLSKDIKICFYEDDVELVRCQAQMLKNYIVQNFTPEKYNSICFYNKSLQKHRNLGCGRIDKLKDQFIEKSSGSDVEPITFNNKTIYFSNKKDKIAVNDCIKSNPALIENWKNTIDEYTSDKGYNIWFNNQSPECTTVGVFSDFYSLERPIIQSMDQLFPDGFKLT